MKEPHIVVEFLADGPKVTEHPTKKDAHEHGMRSRRAGIDAFAYSVADAAKHGLDPRKPLDKAELPTWRDRPILKATDSQALDQQAAALAVRHADSRRGEEAAYGQYQRQGRLEAMAHHFRAGATARASRRADVADRHLLAYRAHAQALGLDPAGKPPPEVQRVLQALGERERGPSYRAHPADAFSLGKAEQVDETGQDRGIINVRQPHEVAYWARKLRCSAEAVVAAVEAVGSEAADVAAFICGSASVRD